MTTIATTNGPADVPFPRDLVDDAPFEAIAAVSLRRLERRRVEILIKGTAPLIAHRFSEKAKKTMLEAQQTKARKKREAKDPQADYEAARYRIDDHRDGFPAVGFKAAIINSCTLFEGITKVAAKQALFVEGEGPDQLVPIICADGPIMREDPVRVGRGVADLRYRPQYTDWSAVLIVRFLPTMLDMDSVIALVDVGGAGGVGEWRPSAPSNTGSYGTWEVVTDE